MSHIEWNDRANGLLWSKQHNLQMKTTFFLSIAFRINRKFEFFFLLSNGQ